MVTESGYHGYMQQESHTGDGGRTGISVGEDFGMVAWITPTLLLLIVSIWIFTIWTTRHRAQTPSSARRHHHVVEVYKGPEIPAQCFWYEWEPELGSGSFGIVCSGCVSRNGVHSGVATSTWSMRQLLWNTRPFLHDHNCVRPFCDQPGPETRLWMLDTTEMLCWIEHTAIIGVEFLSQANAVVHGDLFARNVLLFADEVEIVLPYDEKLEIQQNHITYGEEKGRGGFGIVRHGLLKHKGKLQEVAIKTCRDPTEISDIRSIITELQILSCIGKHPNLIQIIGVITMGLRAPVLILEYCHHGSLRQVLVNARHLFFDKNCSEGFDARCRGELGPRDDYWTIFTTHLLCWAYQIASGMEYLSLVKKIVHCDLFTKNVVISAKGCAKITDFGLSRKIGDDGKQYVRANEGFTPLPELLPPEVRGESRKLSPKVDVWTFGILLWEMFTLGGELDCIKSAEELLNPALAAPEVQALMRRCWVSDAALRIEFTALKSEFRGLLGEGCDPNAEVDMGTECKPHTYANPRVNYISYQALLLGSD